MPLSYGYTELQFRLLENVFKILDSYHISQKPSNNEGFLLIYNLSFLLFYQKTTKREKSTSLKEKASFLNSYYDRNFTPLIKTITTK